MTSDPGISDLGSLCLNGTSASITGPGSFSLGDITLTKGASLYVDNSRGPVTLYVTGQLALYANSTITVADPNPEKFAVYMAGNNPVTLNGGCSSFYGVVYAPYSPLAITSRGEFYGAFVANALKLTNYARVHYDSALRGD